MNTIQSLPDSIIVEIHTIREELATQYHNNLTAYSHAAKEHCRNLGFNTIESPRHQHHLNELQNNVQPNQ